LGAYVEVADNLREGVSGAAGDFLDNVSKVVNEEVQRLSVLGNGSKLHMISKLFCAARTYTYKSVYRANDVADQISHVSNQAQKKRVQVQRVEYALDNLDEVAEPHDKLEVHIDVCNGDVDLLNTDSHTSVDLNKACDLCVEV
jgi:hypothetical protein